MTALATPSRHHSGAFIAAVRRSRALHKGRVSPPATPDAFDAYLASLDDSRTAGFLVLADPSQALAGVINVSEIVRGSFQSAYLGYYAFEPYAGRGLMRDGLVRVIGRCFHELRLHRLEANVQPENERSIALVRGLGFRLEGFSPRYLKVCGCWRDHQRWALLAEEWRPPRAAARA